MRRPGVVGTERGGGALGCVDGLSVLEPEAVWIALGRTLSVPDLVAVGDRLVTGTLRTPPLSSLEALQEAVSAASGQPGTRRVRLAMPRIRVGAWSRPETFVRMLIEQAGLPEPSLNAAIHLGDGRFVIADLSWPEYRVAIEYDGAWHSSQQDADADRHERLVDAGWVVVHVRAHQLFRTPGELVARLLQRLSERGYRHPTSIDLTRLTRFVA